MDNNSPILSAVVDESNGRIKSVHRADDAPKVQDANSIIYLSKDDISRLMQMAENIPGVGNITYEKE